MDDHTSSDRRTMSMDRAVPAKVRVRSEPGCCYLETGIFFRLQGEELLRRFIDRVFRIAAVTMLDVDHEHETVVVRYDRREGTSRELLASIASVLRAAADEAHRSVFQSFLARIPGRIQRIERQITSGKELFVVASGGDGFVARSQQCLGKMELVSDQEPAEAARTADSKTAEDSGVLVLAQEVVVEYDVGTPHITVAPMDVETDSCEIVILGTSSAVTQLQSQRVRPFDRVLRSDESRTIRARTAALLAAGSLLTASLLVVGPVATAMIALVSLALTAIFVRQAPLLGFERAEPCRITTIA